MGRNSIPKIGQWRDGSLYRFRAIGKDESVSSDCGAMIVYERVFRDGDEEQAEVLATAFADGFQEVMAAMFEAGFRKGRAEGKHDALARVRDVLGLG